ncbi:substrate-binding domain-containing protein [Roseivivax isoporae]|uniref:HTH lacI-type domain-containing protein n=1 Tax=Roseivivax isoporae LMG 25204 TaxID=1449351 RepID=X7F538_9RHOB|nr:substrate-binding domain-containing protein [Roseivivax isoporae]ETX27179.1 hypothetical protein RISW2_15435 [Roseivivax isoporae LMG 25204]
MTTLKDLSRHLGLSVTQVSRALNGHSDVSARTRARVETAVKELNYIPNLTARRLVSGRSGVVGLVAEAGPDTPEDSVFFETVLGLSGEFSRRDIQFVLHLMPPGTGDARPVYDRLRLGGGLDGFVLLGPCPGDPRIRHLEDSGVAFVVHGRSHAAPPYPFFDVDNCAILHDHAARLAALGHTRIALVDAGPGAAFTAFREDGYRAALEAAGLRPDPALVVRAPMTEGNGLVAAIRLLSDPATRPTAIICGNLLVAKGVFAGIRALGLTVPGDVSVTAHDDVLRAVGADGFAPALHRTRAPIADSWPHLADFLARAVAGEDPAALQRVAPFKVIEGASIAPPPENAH